MNRYMKKALEEARRGVASGDGGPFGAVIVRGGKIVAGAHNRVIVDTDPTAHAEVCAIRAAAAALGRFDLSDCELYTTCEPCPMCLAAIHWARIPRIYQGCTRYDAADIGFDDKLIYDALGGETVSRVTAVETDRRECLDVFREWRDKADKVRY